MSSSNETKAPKKKVRPNTPSPYQPKKLPQEKYVVEKLRDGGPYDAGARRLKRVYE